MSREIDYEIFSSDEEEEGEAEGEGIGNTRRYPCELCQGSSFATPGKLITHHQNYHVQFTKLCFFGCGYCAKSREGLQKHITRFHAQCIGLYQRMQHPDPVATPTPLPLKDKLEEIGWPRRFQLVEYEHFLIAFDPEIRMARWAFERLTPEDVVRGRRYERPAYYAEPRVQENQQLSEAVGKFLNRDMGHLVAAQNRMANERGFRDSFSFINLVLMDRKVNRGSWKRLELAIRQIAKLWDITWIFTVPVFHQSQTVLVAGGYRIPKVWGFCKIIFLERVGESPIHMCFYIPDRPTSENIFHPGFRATLAKIKDKTGLDFLAKKISPLAWESPASKTSFFCKPCYKAFQTAACLAAHQEKDHFDFQCSRCRRFFEDEEDLLNHMSTHVPYVCEFCGYEAVRKPNFLEHLATHTGEKFHFCDECDAAFVQESALKEHKDSHTDEWTFECPRCHEFFRRERTLWRHQKSPKGCRPGNKKEICDQCLRGFSRKDSLRLHQMNSCTGRPKNPHLLRRRR